MFVGFARVLLCLMSFETVACIKQIPQRVFCNAFSFHGDVVYIASYRYVIQWNMVTDAIVKLVGYSGLLLRHYRLAWLYVVFRVC